MLPTFWWLSNLYFQSSPLSIKLVVPTAKFHSFLDVLQKYESKHGENKTLDSHCAKSALSSFFLSIVNGTNIYVLLARNLRPSLITPLPSPWKFYLFQGLPLLSLFTATANNEPLSTPDIIQWPPNLFPSSNFIPFQSLHLAAKCS